MKAGEILFLNRKEVEGLISPDEVLALTETSLQEYAKGTTVNPIKLSLSCHPYHDGHINSMPSYMQLGDVAGVKVVSVYNSNPRKYGLPTTMGTIILYDPETGLPVSIMDGTYITDQRTGAVSGVNAKHLAKKDSESLAIVGAGIQGYTSMEMTLKTMPNIKTVMACDLSEERCNTFMEKGKAAYPHINFTRCTDHRDALKACDIIIYATSAPRPLLENAESIKPGTTVITVCELLTPKAVKMFDGWYVDFAECALDRYNDGGRQSAEACGYEWQDLTMDLITGEIGDVAIGKVPGRSSDEQKILAGAVGMSVEDVIVAKAVYDAAVAKGVGQILDLQCL